MKHIIYHGDTLKVLKTLPDESVDCIIADPPYAISQKGKKISRKGYYWGGKDIKLDFGEWDIFETEGDFFKFTESWFKECVRVLKQKSWIYVFFDKQKTGYFDLILAPKYEIKSRTIFVWLKTNPRPSFRKVNWISASEFIWVGSKGNCKLKNFLNQKEMFNYMLTPNKSSYGKTEHPTEKPEELIKKFILVNTNRGDLVLDPFLGSGTTMVVAEKLNRNSIGIELNSDYIEIAKKRMKPFLGQARLNGEKTELKIVEVMSKCGKQ